MLTEAEAIECARLYAEQHGDTFRTPVSVALQRQLCDPRNQAAGHQHVYVLALGTRRPIPLWTWMR